jgi:hypothetical protein
MPDIILSGHGTWWPGDGQVTLPTGITVVFYVPDGRNLDDDIGRMVDKRNFGGAAEAASSRYGQGIPETKAPGSNVPNYRLTPPDGFMSRQGSSNASDPDFFTPPPAETAGITLDYFVNKFFSFGTRYPKPMTIHWSACRETVDAAPKYEKPFSPINAAQWFQGQ